MQTVRADHARASIEFDLDELMMLNNALNEVCNGVKVPAFETRLGFDRDTMRALLDRIHELIARMEAQSATK